MEIDFSQKMRRRGPRVKIIPAAEKPPSAGTLAFPNRPELYEVLSDRDKEPGT